MKKITKIKNAIKRKVNESRLRSEISSILDDALPNILAEIDQLDQAFLDAKPVKEEHPHDLPPDDQGLEELDVRKTHGDKRIKNPATGNAIKLRTALKAKKGSAVYAKGKAMYNALKDEPTNERAYASTDGKPYFDYDPGKDKLTEISYAAPGIAKKNKEVEIDGEIYEKHGGKWHGPSRGETYNTNEFIKFVQKAYNDRRVVKVLEGKLTEAQAMNMDTVPYNTIMKMKPGSTIKMKDGKIRTKDKFGNWRANTDPNDIIVNRDVVKHMKGMKGYNMGGGRIQIEGKVNESMIGIRTLRHFRIKDLQKALDKAGIKGYRMDRLSMTLTALKLDKKYFNAAKQIIAQHKGLNIAMAKEGKLNEGSIVTRNMWNRMSDDEKIDALQTVFEDPDDAMKHYEKEWNNLPSVATQNMYTEGKLTEDYSQRARNFRVALRRRLEAMKPGQKVRIDKLVFTKNDKGINSFTNNRGRSMDPESVVQTIQKGPAAIMIRQNSARSPMGDPQVNAYLKFEGKLNEDHFKKGQKVKYQLDRGSSKALRPSTGTISNIKKMGKYYQYTIQDGGPVPVWGAEIIGLAENKVNEMASKAQITKTFSEVSKLSVAMLLNIEKFKAAKAKGDEKAIDKHRKIAYDLQNKKKKMEADLEKMITGIDKDVELAITEGKLTKEDYKYKKYVKKAFGKMFDAMFEFRHAMGVKQAAQADRKIKDTLEELHKKLIYLKATMFQKGLTEGKLNERYTFEFDPSDTRFHKEIEHFLAQLLKAIKESKNRKVKSLASKVKGAQGVAKKFTDIVGQLRVHPGGALGRPH